MAKPTQITLSKKEQKDVTKAWKTCKDARKISEDLHLKRHHVMFFIESQGWSSYSEGSYK
jgi:hypothetical protein